MNYDTINLLGLQPTDVQDIHIVNSCDVIYINITLSLKQNPVLFVAVCILMLKIML
jgi:transposase